MNTKTISISIFKLVLPLFVLLFVQFTANAQTALEQQCFNAVQGKVAYDQAGNKQWSEGNIRNLCQGTTNPSATISCFQNEIRTHNDWSRGISACKPKAASIQNSANAQRFDLNGTWTVYYADGTMAPKPVTIFDMLPSERSSHTLDFSDGDGKKIKGIYSANGELYVSVNILRNPLPDDSKMTGKILRNGTLIRWSDNTAWEKGASTAMPVQEKPIENTPKKTVLSARDMNLAMMWIAAQVSAQRLPFCYRQSFTRDAGEAATTCANGWEKVGLRCYPKCQSGYERSGSNCIATCPQGFSDIGLYCQKPAAYGRGAGWAGYSAVGGKTAIQRCEEGNRSKGDGGSPAGQSCEMWGAYAYPKCKSGFHNVGANICSPDCPFNWQDSGTGCKKPALPSNLSGDAFGCNPGKEKSGELCYNKCNKADYSGVGPVCWQNCPSQMPVNCGAGCATSSKDCALAVTDMVISPVLAAVSLATLGGASGVTATGNVIKGAATQTASKAPGIIAKMKAIYAKIKTEVEVAKLANKAYKTSSSILSERDLVLKEFSDNFAEMTSYEINKTLEERLSPDELAEVKLEWAKRHFYLMGQTDADVSLRNALTLASVIDPTGLLAVEKAFYHPVCKNNTPFPILAQHVK
ncbi:MAG: hypothetical protein K1X72_24215 [Pyrinomonadaceae bacterium]|nr:hypothetical protein [Pyrinomonadaceae bacterium]